MNRHRQENRPRSAFFRPLWERLGGLVLSSRRERLPQLALLVMLLVFLGGGFVFLAEVRGNPQGFARLFDSIWFAVVTIFTVGYGDRVPASTLGRVLAMALILMGAIVSSILSGTIASIFVDRKIREGKGLQDINLRNHTVLCGWNRSAEGVLEGLVRLAEGARTPVVLVNDMDPEQFQALSTRFRGLDLRFVRGDFVNEKVLKRAAVPAARSVVVLTDTSGANTVANADERVILAALAVRALNPQISLSAELTRAENEQHLRRAGVDQVLLDDQFNAFLLANSARSRGIPQVAREILSFDSRSHVRQAPVPAAFVGKTFADLSGHFLRGGEGVLIGFLSEDRKMSLDDILSAGSSAIDEFIKAKFAEAEIEVADGQGPEVQIKLNPGAGLRRAGHRRGLPHRRPGRKVKGRGMRRALRKTGPDRESLRKVAVLAGLDDGDLDLIGRIARPVRVGAGEVLMHEGEVGDSMFLFAEGEVSVTKNLTLKVGRTGFSQAEKSMVRLNARFVSFFGDMAMFERDVRSATITASTDCLLFEIGRDEFEKLCNDRPALGYTLIRRIATVLCGRIRQGNQDVLKLTTALSIALAR